MTIVGHSMGGMLSARFAASFPDITERAVIYDPIGLTDPRYERPWRSADDAYKATMAQTNDQREISARSILAAVSDIEGLRLSRRLAEYEPVNDMDMRRRIAARLLQAERYVV